MLPPEDAATNDVGFSLKLVTTGTATATVLKAVELLLLASVSDEVVVALAVLLSVPGAVGRTTIATFVVCPGARLPTAQITVVVPVQPGEAAKKVTPAG